MTSTWILVSNAAEARLFLNADTVLDGVMQLPIWG